jgi:hypothetical protein
MIFELMVPRARLHFNSVIFKKNFIIVCWSLWCHNIIFDGASLSFSKWGFFLKELELVTLK